MKPALFGAVLLLTITTMTESSIRQRVSSSAQVKKQSQPPSQAVKQSLQGQKNGKDPGEQAERAENKVLMTLLEVRKRFQAKTAAANATSADGVPARPEVSVKTAQPATAHQPDEDDNGAMNWEKEDCVVCSEGLQSKVIGKIDCNSSHIFCFDCIFKWGATCENSCPLCKQEFANIDKLIIAPEESTAGRRLGSGLSAEEQGGAFFHILGSRWKRISSVTIEKRKQRVEDEDRGLEEGGCQLCGAGGTLIMCDDCDQAFCLGCANLTQDTVRERDDCGVVADVGFKIPPEQVPWFCQECEMASNEETGGGRRTRSMSEAAIRRSARRLGRNYGRGRRNSLGGFVVDDGFNDIEDQEWIPDQEEAEASAERHQGNAGRVRVAAALDGAGRD
ncbi:hypothetical protein GUITHDRAFT_134904 [Guillardia theta CCMP2712]|uniref:RING-type domain-containing protein n=1 Tax=Guillardia theta (strain CCMP2712) TaxID=905079 RepID=L1JRU4_GUITC|nr:hypothetical protein GUITHDRAFT_134904 [Guillardia theta CCMP2712]EKX50788.1 hypothetical protein GUITHDRAFT_134904 [Guillardia theta CCMP2712]|eukprot:XP_005837768.1 hypothetical protein GUITHDRAFT_134904 [Guillardia theta CCMP2712]